MVSQVANNKPSSLADISKTSQEPQRPSIQELKQKYETKVSESPKTAKPTIQELKQKYESQVNQSPRTPKPKSPKLLKKLKVKQIACMFNSKISQIVRRDADVSRYNTLVNELSPEPKPVTHATLPKPLPLPRTRYTTKVQAPVPSPRSKSVAKLQKKDICFVAEDVFAKLTVKDKALLYTQFVNDMSRKNPKFGKHADIIEANVKKEIARGEVVNEKQESVKRLLEDLEARCVFPKHTISPAAVQQLNSVKRQSRRQIPLGSPVKSKEFEDIVAQKVSHISTLTITLQRSPIVKRERRARSLPRRKTDGDQLFRDLGLSEASHKRNSDKMRTTLPIEAYAPPKKIRRTRAEHLAPQLCFQNQQLEHLFYSWLKEKHEHEESQQPSNSAEMDEEKQKSTIDKLLEEAIAKLETVEIKQKEDSLLEERVVDNTTANQTITKSLDLEQSTESTPKITPRKKKPAPAVPQQQSTKPVVSSESSTTSSAKHSEAEHSESGISSLPKNTSDQSQPEYNEQPTEDAQNDFIKPAKPMRKKKMRRTLSWKKDSSLVETNTISTTDSESDCKNAKPTIKKTANKPPALELKPTTADNQPEPCLVELDKSLMRVVNSPRKIKSAYTLTVVSPPPYTESTPNKRREALLENDMSGVGKALYLERPHSLTDSFDQGFETGSNEVDSPIRQAPKSILKRQDKIKVGSDTCQVPKDLAQQIPETPSNFSTPIKSQAPQNLSSAFNESGNQQQLCSPISMSLKMRRRSIYDSESRRTSMAMQVIREDQPLEHHEIQSPLDNADVFFANAPTMDIAADTTSSFWIKSDDCTIALDIYQNEPERVRLLYEILSQRSCDTKDIHFGIDGHKFSVHNSNEEETISKRLPQNKGVSHYWFSTGDFIVPFNGKLLTSEKIQRLFQFIKASVEETGVLRFGVDEVEFSNVPEFWTQMPKYSMESSYSMLVGLQSGSSNGLEGRSKYAWPHSKPLPVSDLDQLDFESDDFEENESARSSLSPFGSNHFDLASLGSEELMMPRNSEAMMMSPESFCQAYENEPLDQLFENKQQTGEANLSPPATVAQMMNTLKTQHQHLSSVQERLSCYKNPAVISCDNLDALKGTPEYLIKLKDIVSDISNIGRSHGFRDCSLEELERYMFFLSSYADVCLNSCSEHMDKILDALLEHRAAVFV